MEYDSIEKNMNQKTFIRFKVYIENKIGIRIPDTKKIMVESRLYRRLKALRIGTFKEYEEFFFSEKGQRDEVPRFIECITTNKTDFFREADHFEYLKTNVIPELCKIDSINEIRLWSGASSTGEEAYSMAMLMEDLLKVHPGISYKILATDISEKVLQQGRKAIYYQDICAPIPLKYKKAYCLKSKDIENPTVRIKQELRKRVIFKSINLTDDTYNISKKYHIIFLRNVMIYFNKETQSKILNNIYKHLHPMGYLFLGHSENLPSNSIPFKRVGASIYVKKERVL